MEVSTPMQNDVSKQDENANNYENKKDSQGIQ